MTLRETFCSPASTSSAISPTGDIPDFTCSIGLDFTHALIGRVSSIASADWDDCGYLGNEKGKKQKVIKTDFIPLRSELDCLISWPQGESYAAGLCRETAKNCPDHTNRPGGKRKPRVKSHSLQKIV